MKTKLRVIKIGGNVIDDAVKLDAFLGDFAQMEGLKILVHGGGKLATQLSKKLGIDPQMVKGRRITSGEDLEVVVMIYAGLINKTITGKLQACGCNAMGLSGADANTILAEKRPVRPIDFGWVGDVKAINETAIHSFLQQQITPVFCPLTHDGKGHLLNTNADTIAAELAIGMSRLYETELIYCFEKKGVLANVADENSVITHIDSAKYHELKQQKVVDEGMLPKMENCFHALKNKVAKVIIGNTDVIKNNSEHFTTLTL